MVLTPSIARDRKTEATPIIMNILFFWDTLSATESEKVLNRVRAVQSVESGSERLVSKRV